MATAAMRPYQDLSDEELAAQIKVLKQMGARLTTPADSGLVQESDYVSPGGRRGLTVQQTPEDVLANAIRVEKGDVEAEANRNAEYQQAMDKARSDYNQTIANALAVQEAQKKAGATPDVASIEQRIRGFQGEPTYKVPAGQKEAVAGTGIYETGPRSYSNQGTTSIAKALTPDEQKQVEELQQQKKWAEGIGINKIYDPWAASAKGTTALQRNIPTLANTMGITEKEAAQFLMSSHGKTDDQTMRDLLLLAGKQGLTAEETKTYVQENIGILRELNGQGSTAATKKVVRTGVDKKTGKKVNQYEDGTIGYAD